jgi:succinoglycan biosynthesis protein ExoW
MTARDGPGRGDPLNEAAVVAIIPFYQRDPGVLSRALDSVANQTVRPMLTLVVDDESPLPPDQEIAGRAPAERETIRLLSQANGGPGAARNLALDHLPETTRYVAFLDSDDRWEPDHLERAIAGLSQGHDFYFANYSWPAGDGTRFEQVGLLGQGRRLAGEDDLYRLDADFFDLVLSRWPVHISATVIDRRRLGGVRFDARLRRAAEDQMYFLECASRTSRVCFRSSVGMRLDDGLNMFRRQEAGSLGFSRTRIANAYFHRLAAPMAASNSPQARRRNRRLFWRNLEAFVRSELKSLVRERRLNLELYGPALRTFFKPGAPPRSPV